MRVTLKLCGWKLRGNDTRNKKFEDELNWAPFGYKHGGCRAEIIVNEEGEKFLKWCILNRYYPAFVIGGEEDE